MSAREDLADVHYVTPGLRFLAKSGHWASKPRNYSSSSTQSTSPRKLTVMSFGYAVLIDPGQGQILVALFAKDCKKTAHLAAITPDY